MTNNFKKGFLKEAGILTTGIKFVGKKLLGLGKGLATKKGLGAVTTGAFVLPEVTNIIKKTKGFSKDIAKPIQNVSRYSSVSRGLGQTRIR